MKLLNALLATSFIFSSAASSAARTPRPKDEVAKIAVGPKIEPSSEDETSSPDDLPEGEGDNVDKPVHSGKVMTTDAPRAEDGVDKIELSPSPAAKDPVKEKEAKLPPTVATEKPGHVVDGVSAEQSLKWLTNGNTRYVTKKFRADGRSEKERVKTATAQKPHAIVLSCSDSRVPPEIVFDQGLGEITTIRVAGEVLDSSVIASIEQTLVNDHPHLLVVLGHTHCEAIEAAFNWKEKTTYGSDALDRLVAEIKPHMKTLSTTSPRSPGLEVEAALQADGVGRDLMDRSEIVKKAVESGELKIKTGLYWIDSGKVKFY